MAFKKRILIVEDQNGWMFTQLLDAHNGFELFLAEDGEKAITMFGRYKPDAVVLDLRLPKRHGLQVLEGILKIEPGAYVIILTAYGDAKTRDLCAQAGAREFFTKPLDFKILYNRLKEVTKANLDTVNYSLEHGQKILLTLYRKLGILEERNALLGLQSPPSLILEIEDIQREIERWRAIIDTPPGPASDSAEASTAPKIKKPSCDGG